MMATEAIAGTFATSSSTPDHELIRTETPSQDVSSEPPILINGTSENDEDKQDAEPAEAAVISAEVSVSGGSDTETSKAETSKFGADGTVHTRTASTVKKVASFKPVSVNKKFLAAKTTVTPSKLGDKGSSPSAATQAPSTASLRPRLVAKSGSGLRDAAARTAETANGGKAGGPDGSVVWNKNRPAPTASPKAYTDEELKQQYGIHLATRMKADDAGNKQANWADIDDDDDDWAPAQMEWSDGTKITLPQAEDAPLPVPVQSSSPGPREAAALEELKPKSSTPVPASASPIVKPSGLGTGRAGLILKGASEKPTLVAKPPGPPTPVKSPWAALPPVDKVAPISLDAPQSQAPPSQSRFGQRDPHGFQGMPPPPAKEIAADDFSRSWRENSNSSRELFDSKSGRYEPVNDARRGSRNDARQPSLLQRPPQQDGPAEPSAAFQTHRASGQEGYGRRRTSSNVSGGSGNFMRRMSRGHDLPPAHDILGVRRGSLAAVSDDPSSPRNFSPSGQNQNQKGPQSQQRPSRESPAMSHPSPQSGYGQVIPPPVAADIPAPPAVPYEDPIEEQKKIMRQTRELAIKRRQEQEAKEEAERKERIRLKLEAMGPAPEKKKKDTPKQENAVLAPTQIQARKSSETVKSVASEAPEDAKVKIPAAEDEIIKPEEQSNGLHATASQTQPLKSPQESRSASQNWQSTSSTTSNERYQPWASAPSQQPSRNVWGPPTNDRTLGNGTFNPELSRMPDMHAKPSPIGPPNRGNGNLQQRGSREQFGSRPSPIGPPGRSEPGSAKQQQDRAAVGASPWASATELIGNQDRLVREHHDRESAQRLELEAQGILPPETVIKDTWRQVELAEDGTRSKILANHTLVHGWKGEEDPTTRPIFEDRLMGEDEALRRRRFEPVGTQLQQSEAWRSSSNVPSTSQAPTRGSRFFPNKQGDIRLEEQASMFERPGSPSPPPPTAPGHPAYEGGIHINLPRPSVIVKLPPPVLAPIGPPKPTTFAAAIATPAPTQTSRFASSHQDIRRQEPVPPGGWQDRINHLIGKKTIPVDSSSKHALELPSYQHTATVSLPTSDAGDLSIDKFAITTRPSAEQCFEEQEMGSLPIVKVPNTVPPSAWELAPAPKPIPRKFYVQDSTSRDSFRFNPHIVNNGSIMTIRFPGQENARSVSMPVPRQSSNPRRGGGSRGGSRHPPSARGGRGREASSGFPPSGTDHATNSSTSGRGSRGARGTYPREGWVRPQQPSTPIHS